MRKRLLRFLKFENGEPCEGSSPFARTSMAGEAASFPSHAAFGRGAEPPRRVRCECAPCRGEAAEGAARARGRRFRARFPVAAAPLRIVSAAAAQNARPRPILASAGARCAKLVDVYKRQPFERHGDVHAVSFLSFLLRSGNLPLFTITS